MKEEINLKFKFKRPNFSTNSIFKFIKNSAFAFYKIHPLLLSGKHALSALIFQEANGKLRHASPQQLLFEKHF